ncbi:hypothetical protein CTAYLR_001918 [Chrysophaeum taylorii]|uniref:Uncharacterized protein n=1 Tax=Chrysophaeum taylorii TaxID=2483200 RepID=A0AAD7U937_9STRA|nr:hypothetical protein CTAYLR_001918 [Chrysophaeum taylorii]
MSDPTNPRGCYLTFDAASQGTLFTHWSETKIEGALAFFAPRKTVPAFKFKQAGGRAELIREMSGGTGERIKRYYSGFCQFVKIAKSFNAVVVLYAYDVLPRVDLHLCTSAASDNVFHLVPDAPQDLAACVAVGCVPHPNPCFSATTMSQAYFVSVGHREGVALALS